MTTHLEEHLQSDIDRIRGHLLEMSELAVGALKRCRLALKEQDRKLAYTIILRDQRIDELEKEVDRLCLEFLVRQQPAGAHLRFVYGAIKLNTELERIGDYAESISRQILKTIHLQPFPPLERYLQLADLAIEMLHNAMTAFLDQNEELARQTMLVEDRADVLRDQINADIMALLAEGKVPVEAMTPLRTIARRFERTTDQAKNICEEAVYLATGVYAKHQGAGVWRILFLTSPGSRLGEMAVAVGNSLNNKMFEFSRRAVEGAAEDDSIERFLEKKGVKSAGQASTVVNEGQDLSNYHVVVALGEDAAGLLRPFPRRRIQFEWSMPDLTRSGGEGGRVDQDYEAAFQNLTTHIKDLVSAILSDKEEADLAG